ncbi:hypothetical protein ACJJI4_23890 (plasmid) [Microbulbifer sp. TRSA002]|uniref:hypothetical protein n=1 Tax=Microbulbifer sp. TRSA002 TaxID=3243382 RepID=UPI0040397C23
MINRKRKFWEPWNLSKEEVSQLESEECQGKCILIVDLHKADQAAQAIEELFSPDMPLDELRKLNDRLRVLERARGLEPHEDGGEVWTQCERAVALRVKLDQAFNDVKAPKKKCLRKDQDN